MLETNAQQKYRVLDIRHLPRGRREFRQTEALLSLSPGCSFVLACNELPESLIRYLETKAKDRFQWKILQAGPDLWRILIMRKLYREQSDWQ
jgi:uncharacterized protein (DUF2249 family)